MRRDVDIARAAPLRVAGSLGSALAAFATGVVVARHLGAAGKGTVSMLDLVASLGALTASMGLGDASVTMVRRRGADPARALASSWVAAVVAAVVVAAAAVLVVVAWPGVDHLNAPAVAAMLPIIPLAAMSRVAAGVAQARGHVDVTTGAGTLEGVVTLTAVTVLVAGFGTGPAGALVGLGLGWSASFALLATSLHRSGTPLWAAPDRRYLGEALRLGLPITGAALLSALAGRADLLVVAALGGTRSAGHYSVALTAGQVVVFSAAALAVTSGPMLASRTASEVLGYTLRLARTAVAASIVGAAVLAAASPIAIPLIFGDGFDRAVAPAVILVIGGVLVAAQVTLCRARAVLGAPQLLVRSFGLSVGVMLVLDVLLVPHLDLIGAALASVVAAASGLAVALAEYRRLHPGQVRLAALVPARSDWVTVLAAPIGLVRGLTKSAHG